MEPPWGSPLSPVIADVVMRDLETYCLRKIDRLPKTVETFMIYAIYVLLNLNIN